MEAQRVDRRRRTPGILIALGVVVVLAVGVVVADVALRSYAEDQAESQLKASLPDNVSGDLQVHIGGFSFLQQYLAGTFGTVTVDATDLAVDGVNLKAQIVAHGVPTDLSQPVGVVSAMVTLSESAVNSFLTVPGAATLTLGKDQVGYDGTASFLGLDIDYLVTAAASVTSDSVVLTPRDATLSTGSTQIDLSTVLQPILDQPITVCVASSLPQGVALTGLELSTGAAAVQLEAKNLVLDEQNLSTKGVCP